MHYQRIRKFGVTQQMRRSFATPQKDLPPHYFSFVLPKEAAVSSAALTPSLVTPSQCL